MKSFVKYSIVLSLLFVLFAACEKDKHNSQPPVVTIESPTDTSVYAATDSIPIHISVTHNDELHTFSLSLTQANADSVVYFQYNTHTHDNTYHYKTKIAAPAVSENTELKLTVESVDHNELSTKKTVNFMLLK